jgi:hypothetical protein
MNEPVRTLQDIVNTHRCCLLSYSLGSQCTKRETFVETPGQCGGRHEIKNAAEATFSLAAYPTCFDVLTGSKS